MGDHSEKSEPDPSFYKLSKLSLRQHAFDLADQGEVCLVGKV